MKIEDRSTFAKSGTNPTLPRLSTTFVKIGFEIRKSEFAPVWYRVCAILEVFHEVTFLSTIRSSEVKMSNFWKSGLRVALPVFTGT